MGERSNVNNSQLALGTVVSGRTCPGQGPKYRCHVIEATLARSAAVPEELVHWTSRSWPSALGGARWPGGAVPAGLPIRSAVPHAPCRDANHPTRISDPRPRGSCQPLHPQATPPIPPWPRAFKTVEALRLKFAHLLSHLHPLRFLPSSLSTFIRIDVASFLPGMAMAPHPQLPSLSSPRNTASRTPPHHEHPPPPACTLARIISATTMRAIAGGRRERTVTASPDHPGPAPCSFRLFPSRTSHHKPKLPPCRLTPAVCPPESSPAQTFHSLKADLAQHAVLITS